MTTTLTLPDGFTAKALDAAASALDAVAAGLPFQVDDLIAGAMALEWMRPTPRSRHRPMTCCTVSASS